MGEIEEQNDDIAREPKYKISKEYLRLHEFLKAFVLSLNYDDLLSSSPNISIECEFYTLSPFYYWRLLNLEIDLQSIRKSELSDYNLRKDIYIYY